MYLFEQYGIEYRICCNWFSRCSIITIDHDNCNDGQKPFATEKI